MQLLFGFILTLAVAVCCCFFRFEWFTFVPGQCKYVQLIQIQTQTQNQRIKSHLRYHERDDALSIHFFTLLHAKRKLFVQLCEAKCTFFSLAFHSNAMLTVTFTARERRKKKRGWNTQFEVNFLINFNLCRSTMIRCNAMRQQHQPNALQMERNNF